MRCCPKMGIRAIRLLWNWDCDAGIMKTAQRYLLLFGEFSPTDQWKDATFTLDWGGAVRKTAS